MRDFSYQKQFNSIMILVCQMFVLETLMVKYLIFDICDVYFWGGVRGGNCVVKDDWIVHHGSLPM